MPVPSAFYHELGFYELSRENGTIYMGRALAAPSHSRPPACAGKHQRSIGSEQGQALRSRVEARF